MTLTDVGTRYNGMELSPERVAAFFFRSLTPNPSPKGEGSKQRVIPMVVLSTSSNQQ